MYIAVAGLLLALVYAGIFFCFILIFSFLKTLIYLFLAVLGLSCSAWASLQLWRAGSVVGALRFG